MAFVYLSASLAALVLWLFSIRPYCRRNGKGFTTGANIGITFWVDWQQAQEIAKKQGDQGMILVCRIWLWMHVIVVCVILFTLIHLWSQTN